ncbi:hypothetical protein QYF36_017608 [Acer negundo]|nr:hypothetical protein QYF36_017608 [Acer negundo]
MKEPSLCVYADTHNSGDQETFFDSHPYLPSASDSEDDFRSVNTEFSRSHRFSFTCPSPLNKTITRNEADKKLYQLFDDDPFWSDQVVNSDFFQDSLSIHQLVVANSSSSTGQNVSKSKY